MQKTEAASGNRSGARKGASGGGGSGGGASAAQIVKGSSSGGKRAGASKGGGASGGASKKLIGNAPAAGGADAAPVRVLVEVHDSVLQRDARLERWRKAAQDQGIGLELVVTSKLQGRVPQVTVVGDNTHAAGPAVAAAHGARGAVVVTADWVQNCIRCGVRLGWERFLHTAIAAEEEDDPEGQAQRAEAERAWALVSDSITGRAGAAPEDLAKAWFRRRFPGRGPLSDLRRAWVDTSLGPTRGGGAAFKVVTWNKLATEGFLGSNGGPKWYVDEKYRTWSHRGKLILEQLERIDADIILLQEVSSTKDEWYGVIKEWADRRGYLCSTGALECRIMVRASRFQVLQWGTVSFQGACEAPRQPAEDGAHPSGDGSVREGEGGDAAPAEVQWADDPWSIVSRIPDCTAVAALRCKVSGRLLVAASMHVINETWLEGVKVLMTHTACRFVQQFAARAQRKHGAFVPPARGGPSHTTRGSGGGGGASGDAGGSAGGIKSSGGVKSSGGGGGAGDVPIILGGDFNSVPGHIFDPCQLPHDLAEPPPPSPVYQLLSTGRLPPSSPGHPHTWNLWWQQERRRRTRLDPGHDPKRARAAAPAHPPAGRSDELRLSLGPLQSGAVAATGAEPALTFYGPRLAATLDYVWVTPGALEAVGWLAMPWETPGNGYGDEEGRPVAYSAVGALRAPDEAMRTLTWLPHDRFPSDHIPVGVELQLR